MTDPNPAPAAGIRVACPACRTIYEIQRNLLGKKLVCAKCKVDWTAISSETLQAATDHVSDVDAELMDLSTVGGEKTATLTPDGKVPHDYWLGKKIGRYQIDSILGTGALGYVYRGHDAQLSRDVALKILNKAKADKMTIREKLFVQEARAAARLQHPNIVTIHEVGLDGDFYYFAMEVVDGGTLKDLTLALGKLSPARACFLIAQAAQALAFAHSKGVIHRDVKPDNLMMDRRGVMKVADFGLAEIGEVDVMKIYQNRPLGTPGYVAPEVARGEGATTQSDIYCLGLCLYHALTGKKYFAAADIKTQLKLCANPPEFEPTAELAGVPRECIRILAKCLQKDPPQRYLTAQELAEDLRRFVVDMGRDDSRSRLPLPGLDLFTGQMADQPRSRWSAIMRSARSLFRRLPKKSPSEKSS